MKLKTILINVLLALSLVNSMNCSGAEETPDIQGDIGYFFGFSFGNMLKEGGNNEVDLERLLQGMHDALKYLEDNAKLDGIIQTALYLIVPSSAGLLSSLA